MGFNVTIYDVFKMCKTNMWHVALKAVIFQGYFNTAERVGKRQSRPKEVIPIEYSSPEHTLSRVYSNTDEFGIAVVVYEMIFGRYT